jgi:class 3 adenylate cyclase
MRALLDNPPDLPEGSSRRKRKLAAILHADVVGFSRLMGKDEAGTHRALGELRSAVDPLITAHGGRIVGPAGDIDEAVAVGSVSVRAAGRRATRMSTTPDVWFTTSMWAGGSG